MTTEDSIPLNRKVVLDSDGPGMSIKSVVILFMLFLFVVSDVYTNSILCNVNGAIYERNATNIGVVLQGISLVILFIVANYLIKYSIL
jgi:hypothetical protein